MDPACSNYYCDVLIVIFYFSHSFLVINSHSSVRKHTLLLFVYLFISVWTLCLILCYKQISPLLIFLLKLFFVYWKLYQVGLCAPLTCFHPFILSFFHSLPSPSLSSFLPSSLLFALPYFPSLQDAPGRLVLVSLPPIWSQPVLQGALISFI